MGHLKETFETITQEAGSVHQYSRSFISCEMRSHCLLTQDKVRRLKGYRMLVQNNIPWKVLQNNESLHIWLYKATDYKTFLSAFKIGYTAQRLSHVCPTKSSMKSQKTFLNYYMGISMLQQFHKILKPRAAAVMDFTFMSSGYYPALFILNLGSPRFVQPFCSGFAGNQN